MLFIQAESANVMSSLSSCSDLLSAKGQDMRPKQWSLLVLCKDVLRLSLDTGG